MCFLSFWVDSNDQLDSLAFSLNTSFSYVRQVYRQQIFSVFVYLIMSLYPLHIWKLVLLELEFFVDRLSLWALWIWHPTAFQFLVSANRSAINLAGIPMSVAIPFSLAPFKIYSYVWPFLPWFISGYPWIYLAWSSLSFLDM